MLAYLSAKYNLIWYFDGDVLFYKTQEIRKEIISPDDLSIKSSVNYLRNSGLSDGKNCAVKTVTSRGGLRPGSNDSFSSVIGDTDNFIVRLKALQQNSRARVLSRPSVVTLNNIPAGLDKNITCYTKLQGDKVDKFESITSGFLLRATPRMINDNRRHEALLNLSIKGGVQKV